MKDIAFRKLAAALAAVGISLNDVDRLALKRAQIARLRDEEKEIEKRVFKLVANPDQVADGFLVRVRHVFQIRRGLNSAEVRRLLHPNQLRVCERVTEVHALKVTGFSTVKGATSQPEEVS